MVKRCAGVFSLAVLCACTGTNTAPDAASPSDASTTLLDAGTAADAGSLPDAGPQAVDGSIAPDAAPRPDASVTTDAGPPRDAAQPTDAAPQRDSAVAPDAALAVDAAVAVDAALPPDAAVTAPDAGMPPSPGVDLDGDGLEDLWEFNAGAVGLLDWRLRDTNNNGTQDGDEDSDDDGLTNLDEYHASLVPRATPGAPHPLRLDVLVELDCMEARCLSAPLLALASAAFAEAPRVGAAGVSGVGLHVYLDEVDLTAVDFDGSFPQRHAFLQGHPPQRADLNTAVFPRGRLLHAAVVTRRTDDASRGGEVITDSGGTTEKTGLLLYHDALDALFPQCGVTGQPDLTDITLDEALTTTFVHELGHMLQLGHDTDVGGGVNLYNVMSVPTSCVDGFRRFRGWMNNNPALGATQTGGGPRFSAAAAALFRLDEVLGVDTALLVGNTGREM
jgi:hypothetical protein